MINFGHSGLPDNPIWFNLNWFGCKNIMRESDNARRKRLTKLITDNCVVMDLRSVNNDVGLCIEWCIERFGPCRSHHPLREAQEGWIDFFEGHWAVTYGVPEYSTEKWLFWFEKDSDLIEFKLAWK
jgi:hypothetical protein